MRLEWALLGPPPPQAERYYIKCGMPLEAVDMYSRAGKWEASQKVARGYLADGEIKGAWVHPWGGALCGG